MCNLMCNESEAAAISDGMFAGVLMLNFSTLDAISAWLHGLLGRP